MFDIVEKIRADAVEHCRTVVLPESDDERIIRAAVEVRSAGIAQPVLLGSPVKIKSRARALGLSLAGITLYDVAASTDSEALLRHLRSCRRYADSGDAELKQLLQNPLVAAASLLAIDEVDACVAGAVYTTTEVIQQALRIVGTAEGSRLLSSFFLMVFARPPVEGLDFALYADCAININPTCEQLADIAYATAESASRIFQLTPKTALLSFSTAGSASHPDVDKVACALNEVRSRYPGLEVIGDVQFDAALLPEVRKLKMADAAYSEPANVFVFPDLDAGNIAYKITERLAGARAVGPILQGLRKPMNDLSRGADVESIVNTIAMSCLQVENETTSIGLVNAEDR